jgi:hypothetical protein
MTETDTDTQPGARLDDAGALVASRDANQALEHSQGGTTTRSDATDLGVPMLQGAPSEPVGPEDALGKGPKRGDYSGRLALETQHHATELIPQDERVSMAEALVKDAGKNAADQGFTVTVALGEVPTTRVVDQTARAGEVGDSPGKGGVSTQEATAPAGS